MRYLVSDGIRFLRLRGRNDEVSCVKRLFPLLRQANHVPGKTKWKNAELVYVDAPAVYYQLSDIYIDQVYDFPSDQSTPYILDVGAHIGLASLRFRQLYPCARIISFEPDPKIAACLRTNLANHGDRLTEVVEAAAWTKKGSIGFNHTGDDSGGISTNTSVSQVPTIDLATYCGEQVDFLKLDIEGAEFDVLRHLHDSGALNRVRRIFIELHHWKSPTPPRFHEALKIIAKAGFDYRIRTSGIFSDSDNEGSFANYADSSNLVILCAWRQDEPEQ